MRLAVYGTLRKGEPLSHVFDWATVKHPGKVETMEISGLRIYILGTVPGAKLGSKSDKAVVELWDLDLPKNRELTLLSMLDQMEGVRYGLYERSYIDTPKGKALVYTYCGNVERCLQIKDWKVWQKKSYKEKVQMLKGTIEVGIALA